MSVIWQTVIFVIVGTIVVASAMMAVLMLAIRLQRVPAPIGALDAGPKAPMRKNRKLVTFEVDGKRVDLRIDVSDVQTTAVTAQT